MSPVETIRQAFPDHEFPLISYGLPFPEACRKHVEDTFKASRIYIIASSTLARTTVNLSNLQKALGNKVVGTRIGMKPHTLWSEILEIVHDTRKLKADLIITLGGGSLTDGAKVVAMALANDVQTREQLMNLPNVNDGPQLKNVKTPTVRIITVPTSLSGGEYSNYGGATDDETQLKFQFSPPLKGPALIVLDGALNVTTPLNIWLQSGVRAIDHCVETLCSLKSDPISDRASEQGLRALVPALLKCQADAFDAEARLGSLLGVNHAMVPLNNMVFAGASHGIGHMLGPLGVGHGETSCILLPAVCKYNAAHKANVERQQAIINILWTLKEIKPVLEKRGLKEGTADLGDMLDAVIRELGMPRTLKEVNVGRDKLDSLAENSLQDVFMATNPVPITKKEQVLEILEMVVD